MTGEPTDTGRSASSGERARTAGQQALDVEASSPAGHAADADERGTGFLDRDSLVAELNILLEAERAGARVAARLLAETEHPELKDLAGAIHRDEVHWCKMLLGALESLEATPSQTVGRFYEQVMGLTDTEARFALINRGQAWVVRRLKALLPLVRDDQLHGALLGMLAAHHHNISRAEITLAALARVRTRPGA